MQKYTSQIERMFNKQFTVRKPSRELTYIQEEDEDKLPEIKVTKVRQEETNDTLDNNKETEEVKVNKNVTIVNLEHEHKEDSDKNLGDNDGDVSKVKDNAEEVDDDSEEPVTKEHLDKHDKHVRFTAKVEEIDFKEADLSNEKTS